MPEFRRPLHRRIAGILARMDPDFLEEAGCYFGGGTQIVMAHGEYRESRDIDFLVSSAAGQRTLRRTVHERSLGPLFRRPVLLHREVRVDRYAFRTHIKETAGADPIKFEIVLEDRIELAGARDAALGVPVLERMHAIAEKLMANWDRGRDRVHLSRDLIDLAFFSAHFHYDQFAAACALPAKYGVHGILGELRACVRMLTLDRAYREKCVRELAVEDSRGLRAGLERLNAMGRKARLALAPARPGR